VPAPLELLREDHARIAAVLERLVLDAAARAAFVVHRNGEVIASAGEAAGLDATSLGSLSAGSVAATQSLARLVGQAEFSALYLEGSKENLHVNVVPGGGIVLVWFDRRSSLGLVRVRVKRATGELASVFEDVARRGFVPAGAGVERPLFGLTDDDIDALLR
jgi:predicted regulator of Ras-like GTPase activity (Roadblock/LC7/MglB family)